MVNHYINKGDKIMPRKKKTETTDSVEAPKKEVKTTRYGAVAMQKNAALKKPVLRGSLK